MAGQQLPVTGLQLGSHHAARQVHLPELAKLLQFARTARHTTLLRGGGFCWSLWDDDIGNVSSHPLCEGMEERGEGAVFTLCAVWTAGS